MTKDVIGNYNLRSEKFSSLPTRFPDNSYIEDFSDLSSFVEHSEFVVTIARKQLVIARVGRDVDPWAR